MVHPLSDTGYIPAYEQYQTLLNYLASESSSMQNNVLTEEQYKKIKMAWYEDQLYSLFLLLAHRHTTNTPLIKSNLESYISLFSNQLSSAKRGQEIAATAISVIHKLSAQAKEAISIKSLETALVNNIEQTVEQSTQDTAVSRELWQAIANHWNSAYRIFAAFQVSEQNVHNTGPQCRARKDSTQDTADLLEGMGNSPPSRPHKKPLSSSRKSSAIYSNSSPHIQSLQDTIGTLKADKAEAIDTVRTVQQALDSTKHSLYTTQQQLSEAYARLDQILQQEYDTNSKLTALQKTHKKLAQQKEEISAELSSLQAAYHARDSEVQTLQASKTTWRKQVEQLESANRALKKNAAHMQQEVHNYWVMATVRDEKVLAKFIREHPDCNTLIALLKEHQQKITFLQKEQEALFKHEQTLQADLQKAIHKLHEHEIEAEMLTVEIAKWEEQGSKTSDIKALRQKHHECNNNLQQAQEECSTLRHQFQGNNQRITVGTTQITTLRLAMNTLYAEAQKIDPDAVQALDLTQAIESQTDKNSLLILHNTTQWLIQYIPYLSWSFAHYLFILLQEHYQHAGLSFDRDLKNNMTDIQEKLYQPNNSAPLISKAWISGTTIHTQAAYIPYDFYQGAHVKQKLKFQKNLTLEVQSLGKKSVQLDLFYAGTDHIKIEQLKEEIFAFTSLLVTHAETYPHLEIEMEVNNDYAEAIFDNLKAYQVLDTAPSLVSGEKTVKLKLNKNSQFDRHIMIEHMPLPNTALLNFSDLLTAQSNTRGNTIA